MIFIALKIYENDIVKGGKMAFHLGKAIASSTRLSLQHMKVLSPGSIGRKLPLLILHLL